jgi:hypothetical protein
MIYRCFQEDYQDNKLTAGCVVDKKSAFSTFRNHIAETLSKRAKYLKKLIDASAPFTYISARPSNNGMTIR